MDMGSKLLAAFGAGALLASSVFYFKSKPNPLEPLTIPPIAVAAPQAVEPSVVDELKPVEEPKPTRVATPPAKRRDKNNFGPAIATPEVPAASLVSSTVSSTSINADLPAFDTPVEEPAAISTNVEFPPPVPQTVTLPAGTLIQIRLAERLASNRNFAGDAFAAVLDHELVVDGWVIAEAGARVYGRIVNLSQAGRIKGTANMTLELTSITTSDGQKIRLHTATFLRKGDTSKSADTAKIGVGAVVGAAIGGAIGGGPGAAIGAASGGAIGAGTVLATRGKATALEVETRLSFRLDDPVTVTERRSN